jgi:hypothetical protein
MLKRDQIPVVFGTGVGAKDGARARRGVPLTITII